MLTRRIIACLDVTAGRVVKGVQVRDLVDAGDPAELAARQPKRALTRSSCSTSRRRTKAAARCSKRCVAPRAALYAVHRRRRNPYARRRLSCLRRRRRQDQHQLRRLRRPELITKSPRASAPRPSSSPSTRAAARGHGAEVFIAGGRKPAGREALEWAREAEQRGAGEILLTSMDADGTRDGFDCELTAAVSEAVEIPVIASGGAGTAKHFSEVFSAAKPTPRLPPASSTSASPTLAR